MDTGKKQITSNLNNKVCPVCPIIYIKIKK
nr:MAG TPA: C2H2 type zinc-finger protein [Caudoviricetes sp.]